MTSTRHLLLVLIGCLVACGDTAGDAGECSGPDCDADAARPLPDATAEVDAGTPDAEADTSSDAAPDADLEPEVGPGCEPSARVCIDEDSWYACAEDGSAWGEPVVCDDDQTCRWGTCLDNGPCTPGILDCYDDTSVLVCDENGFDTRVESCGQNQVCLEDRCVDQACIPTEKSYIGCDFYASDLDNEGTAQTLPTVVTVSNTRDHEVGVTLINQVTGVRFEDTIGANSLESYSLNGIQVDDTSLSSRTFRIQTTAPVTAHQFNPRNNRFEVYTNDASLLLPAGALGQEYMVLGWPTETPPDASYVIKGFVAVIATQDGTQVTVRTPVEIDDGDGVEAIAAGEEAQIAMDAGEILTLTTTPVHGADLSGLEVSASAPVAVMTGAECANVPLLVRYCDHLESQVMPLDSWGTEYVGAKFRARGDEPDVWRVLASQDGTTLTTVPPLDGVDGEALDRGQVLEFVTASDFVLSATAPVSLAQLMVGSQYPADGADQCLRPSGEGCAIPTDPVCELTAIGDPSLLLTVPTNQLRDEYLLLTPAEYAEDYLTVILREGTEIDMDGAALDTAAADVIEGTDWRILRFPVQFGTHELTGTDVFALYAYGYDCDVSYAYPGGLNLETE